MDPVRDAWDRSQLYQTRAQRPPQCSTSETKGKDSTDHVDAVIEEAEKLKEASAITEVLYPNWLSNTMVVKKKIVKWRVC